MASRTTWRSVAFTASRPALAALPSVLINSGRGALAANVVLPLIGSPMIMNLLGAAGFAFTIIFWKSLMSLCSWFQIKLFLVGVNGDLHRMVQHIFVDTHPHQVAHVHSSRVAVGFHPCVLFGVGASTQPSVFYSFCHSLVLLVF